MLQVVTFNIGGARKLRGENFLASLAEDTASVLAAGINFDAPFLMAFQEIGEYLPLDPQIDDPEYLRVIELLSDEIGATKEAFVAEVDSQSHYHPRLWELYFYKNILYAAEGNGILSNLEMAAWDWGKPAEAYPAGEPFADDWQFFMSTQISHAALYSTGTRDTQPRNAMIASLEHPEYGALHFINTHFGAVSGENRHNPDDERTQVGTIHRREQAGEILRIVRELRQAEIMYDKPARPIILTGDFNAIPGSAPMNDLCEVFTLLEVENPASERFTHRDHTILIDHILIDDPRGVLPEARAQILTHVPADLTDHLPVIAIFGE